MPSSHVSEEDIREQLDLIGSNPPKPTNASVEIHLGSSPTKWEELGPLQVQTILAFVVSPETERSMSNASIEGEYEDRIIKRKRNGG